MKVDKSTVDNQQTATGDGGRGLVFWLLVGMSVCVLAPCAILPAWRDYQAADLNHRIAAQQLAHAEKLIQRQRRRLDAVRNDPAVVTRLAQRELEFRVPGQRSIPVPISAAPEPPRVESAPTPTHPPLVLARLSRFLPDWDFDALFCKTPTRETLMVLSLALMASAFVIFWPSRQAAEVASQ